MRRAVPTALAFLCALLLAESASGVSLEEIGRFQSPVYVTSEPGNADRLYVVQQDGQIRLVTPNADVQFVDLDARVLSAQDGGDNEEGLLSVAFDPEFASTGLLYVFYTDNDGNLQVSELTADGNSASISTLRPVLNINHPVAGNHNGGQLNFGRDGFLYISTGDGDVDGTAAQNLSSLLGKILRIDPARQPAGNYGVPPDNPFAGGGGSPEIWSSGLRNPSRFSFDRVTGDLTIGDVGEVSREEVNFSPASTAGRGANFGWPCLEGSQPGPTSCTAPNPVSPVLEYGRGGGVCAVTGGYVVRDPGLTELFGRYVYADYCAGQLRSAVLALPSATGDRSEGLQTGFTTSLGEDACGRVYVVSRGTSAAQNAVGPVSRLVDGTPTDCSAVLPPPPPPEVGACGAVVRGSEGDDELRGGPGSQELIGLRGDDRLRGEDGADCLEGGAGRDALRGGDGRDDLDGGAGGDSFNSRDGARDRVVCGSGRDQVKADREDRLRGCERVARRG